MKWGEYLAQFPPRDPLFVEKRYARGHLPAELQQELRMAVEKAPVIPFTNDSRFGDVAASHVQPKEMELLNRDHAYRDLDGPTSDALVKVFAHLKGTIASLLNAPWRVLNVRSWTTKHGAWSGPNSWHADGDLHNILKLMLYGTPTGGQYGGLEYEEDGKHQLNGESWFLFYNSVLRHRGVGPSVEGLERVATEVTLCPSHEFQLEPVFLGLAARYPVSPLLHTEAAQ